MEKEAVEEYPKSILTCARKQMVNSKGYSWLAANLLKPKEQQKDVLSMINDEMEDEDQRISSEWETTQVQQICPTARANTFMIAYLDCWFIWSTSYRRRGGNWSCVRNMELLLSLHCDSRVLRDSTVCNTMRRD